MKGRVVAVTLVGLLCGALGAAEEAVGYVLAGTPAGPPQLGMFSLSYSGTSIVDCSPPVGVGGLGQDAWGMAVSPTGRLYALDIANDRLLVVDSADGATSPAVSLDIDVNAWGDLAFDSSGQLWMAAGTRLYTIDLETGSTALVGEIGEEIEKLAAHAGSLYGALGARLLRIDPETGHGTLVRDYNEPWGGLDIWALGSDGQNLWGIVHGWSEVSPSPYYEVALLNPATGQIQDFRSFDLPQDEPFTLEILRQQQAPAVPGTTFLGSVLFVGLLALAGLTLGVMMPQREGRLSSRATLPACVNRFGGY